MTDTEERFANLELDGPPKADNTPPAPKPTAPEPMINEAAALKGEYERQVAAKYGIEISNDALWYANGHKMLDIGVDKARKDRRLWEQKPSKDQVIEEAKEAIAAENRKDVETDLHEWRLDDNGLFTRGNGRLVVSDNAYRQLAYKAPESEGSPGRYNLNAWLKGSGKKAVLRTRFPDASTNIASLYAAVSTRFAKFDVPDIAEALAKEMPTSSRGNFKYDGSKAVFDFSLHNPNEEVAEMTVGRMHEFGCRVETADDGTNAFRIVYYALRRQCVNCTLIKKSKLVFSKRHVGTEEKFREMVRAALANAGDAVGEFASMWQEAHEKAIHSAYDGTELSAREVFAALVENGYVHVKYTKKKPLVDLLMDYWNVEPGDTVAHVNMAITRMAHMETWKSRWATDELEEQAGDLLFAKTYRVNPVLDEERRGYYELD